MRTTTAIIALLVSLGFGTPAHAASPIRCHHHACVIPADTGDRTYCLREQYPAPLGCERPTK